MVDNPLTRPYFWGGWRGVALDSHDMIYESCLKNVHFPVDPNYPLKKCLFEPLNIYIYYNATSNRFSRVNWGATGTIMAIYLNTKQQLGMFCSPTVAIQLV